MSADKLIVIPRLLMGSIFLIMGINGFFKFFTITPTVGKEAEIFLEALTNSNYFWPFEKSLEIICGLFLLSNRFVPLAIEVLAPILVNIFLFHLFLDLDGIFPALVVLICEVWLFIYYWPNHFKHLFSPKHHIK